MALLLEIEAPDGPIQHELAAGLTIGRASGNAVVLDSGHVSRHHARIDRTHSGFCLVDLGSANGTFLNGVPLEPRVLTPIGEGDAIVLGETRLAIRRGELPAALGAGGPQAARAELFVLTPAWMRKVPLSGDLVSIGRAAGNAIVIDDPHVSGRHLVIRRLGSQYQAEDQGSTGGIVIGGERVSTRLLADRDIITLGEGVSLCFLAPEVDAGIAEGILRAGPGAVVTLGREAGCDIVVDDAAVSRLHARLTGEIEGAGQIEDLGSTNGTFVNGARLEPNRPALIQPGDSIQIGQQQFSFQVPRADAAGAPAGVALRARGLSRSVRGGKLLQDVSLRIGAGEFVAIVGASGSGKSTLLKALCGIAPASGGDVLIFGRDLRADYAALRTMLGYVPQDESLHLELPVGRALDYAAQLRLPEDTSASERAARVAAVLEELGLVGREATPVGLLSGGERKRVSIAVELITRPGMFFLDEATSGLDPAAEAHFMRLLRHMADDGHTVVLVTHATKNVMLCDQVVFMAAGGQLAYAGPPDQALGYFAVSDFDGIYDRLAGEATPAAWADRFRASPSALRHAEESTAAVQRPPAPGDAKARGRGGARHASSFRQFRMLTRRSLDILLRDRVTLAILLLIAPLAGLLNFAAWPQDVLDPRSGLPSRAFAMAFIVSVFAFVIGAISQVRELVKERMVLARERKAGLALGPYLASKIVLAGAFALYHGAVLTALLALRLTFPDFSAGDYAALAVTMILGVASASAVGLLVSAVAAREDRAVYLAIGVVLLSVVFSGGVLPLKDLGPAGQIAGAAMPSSWSFRGMVTSLEIVQGECAGDDLARCALPGAPLSASAEERERVIEPVRNQYQDVMGFDFQAVWPALGLITIAALALTAGVLIRRDPLLRG